MARKFLTNLDMSGNQLLNATFEKLAEAPTTGNFEGRMYYNTSDDLIYVNNGSGWTAVGSVTSIQGTENEVVVSASIGSVTLSLPETINADTTGNAATATALETARTISLGGDLSGSASFDGTGDITITAIVDSESAVDSIANVDGNLILSASVGAVSIDLASSISANVTGDLTGNADTASALETSRTIALGGDLSGSATFDGSASITINATIEPDSVALGTDTTGDYVLSVSASDGISASGTGESASVTLTNTDKGSSQDIFKTLSTDSGSISAESNSASVTFSGGAGINTSASAGIITVSNTGVIDVQGTANQVDVSASVGSTTLSLSSTAVFPGTVTLNADPTQALHAATKQYVDAVVEGLHVHASVATATTASVDLSTAPAAIDGVTLTDGMRVLVKDQSNAAQNGIYVYDEDSGELVRAEDYDTAGEIQAGDFVFVSGGSTYNNTGWVQENDVTTLGTDPIVWDQFSGAGTFVAGNGLTLTGTSFAIDTAVTVDVNSEQTLSNKTLTSPEVTGLYIADTGFVVEGTDDEHETTVVFTDPTEDRTITFKNGTGTVAFTTDIPTTTDGLTEGSTNLYFTAERAEDAIGAILIDTPTIDLTYNDNGASVGNISADVILKASNSYLSSASGLAIDISALETKLVTDSFTKKASASVGNGSATSFAVSHNLNTEDVLVQVFDNATHDTVEVDVVRTDVNTVTVSFATAPSSNAYRVVVIG
jgi:hypothetical protein